MDSSNPKRTYISFRSEGEAKAAQAAAKKQQDLINKYATQANRTQQNQKEKSKRIIQKGPSVERQILTVQRCGAQTNRSGSVPNINGARNVLTRCPSVIVNGDLGDVEQMILDLVLSAMRSRPNYMHSQIKCKITTLNFYQCRICGNDPRNAVVTICGHLFCWGCIWQYERTRISNACCPYCKRSLQMHEDVVPYYSSGVNEDGLNGGTVGAEGAEGAEGTEGAEASVMRPSAFRVDTTQRGCPWFVADPSDFRLDPVHQDIINEKASQNHGFMQIILVLLMMVAWILL